MLLAKRLLFVCGRKSTTWGVMQHAMHISKLNPDEIVDLINSSMPISDQDTSKPATAENPHYFHINYLRILLGCIEGRHYMKNFFSTQSNSNTTERWLELIHNRVCKHPHDLVYSILGIVPPSVANAMAEPNYEQPATETFKQFAKAFIVGTRSLNILCYSHHSDSQNDLPSWVFDWRRESRLNGVHDFAGYIGTMDHRKWHSLALACEKYTPTFSEDLSTISVHGITYGTVSKIKLEYELFPNMTKITKDVEEIDVLGAPRCHHTMHQRSWWKFKDDARALLGDAPPDSPLLQNDQARTLLYLFLPKEDQIRLSNCRTQKQTRWGKANNFEDVYAAMQSTTKCRTVFKTNNGIWGLAPMWTKPKDIVCQFFGCTAAVILRRSDNQTYRLVGDCYVFGKMGKGAINCLEYGREKDLIERFTII